jgi:hypothetical protein
LRRWAKKSHRRKYSELIKAQEEMLMRRLKKTYLALTFIFGVFTCTLVMAADFTCSPTEVAVFPERIHVKCSTSTTDGSAAIWFWAISTSDAQKANRFLSTASTALVSGRSLRFSFNPGDTAGVSFGCLAKDCRTPWAIAIY